MRELDARRNFETRALVELIGWLRLGESFGYFGGSAPEDDEIVYSDDAESDTTTVGVGDIRGAIFEHDGTIGRLKGLPREGRQPWVSLRISGVNQQLAETVRAVEESNSGELLATPQDAVDFDLAFNEALDDLTDARRRYLWAVWPNSPEWDAFVRPLRDAREQLSAVADASIEVDQVWAIHDRLRGRESGLQMTAAPAIWRSHSGVQSWAQGRQDEFDGTVAELNASIGERFNPSNTPWTAGVDQPASWYSDPTLP